MGGLLDLLREDPTVSVAASTSERSSDACAYGTHLFLAGAGRCRPTPRPRHDRPEVRTERWLQGLYVAAGPLWRARNRDLVLGDRGGYEGDRRAWRSSARGRGRSWVRPGS